MIQYGKPVKWYLRISEDAFKRIYKGFEVDINLFKTQPDNQEQLLTTYLPSKLWRLNNLYTIVDKDGGTALMNMNFSQHHVYAASLLHARLIILKSRQQGISTFWLIFFVDDGVINSNFTIGLMAQGLDESATLLQRVKLAWDSFPSLVKQALKLNMVKDNSKELKWSNGSIIFIRTSFRSATLQRLHISELAKIAMKNPKRALETKTGTLQTIKAGNICVIESTAEGNTMFTTEWNKAVATKASIDNGDVSGYQGKQFQPVFLAWFIDDDCKLNLDVPLKCSKTISEYFDKLEIECNITLSDSQRNFWLDQYEELGETIYQEYPATPEEAFMKVHDGSYYGRLYNKLVVGRQRIRDDLYDSNLPVTVSMDIGVDDTFVLGFWQQYKQEVRLINEYANSGEGLEHYANVIKSMNYQIDSVIVPHDIMVTEMNYNKTRLARFKELGIRHIKVLTRSGVSDGIENVRKHISNLYIDRKCTYIQDCFIGYTKEWDENVGAWKDKPMKSEWNHGADMVRYYYLGFVEYKEIETTFVSRDFNSNHNDGGFDL